jgi:endogenous inhibitor of DNA gyrase (YacG/DUF329 family)
VANNAKARCPVCGKPAAARFRPFCSGRCVDVDLARWFTGAYRIPSEEPGDGPDDFSEGPEDEE